jgi:hypothetical protein
MTKANHDTISWSITDLLSRYALNFGEIESSGQPRGLPIEQKLNAAKTAVFGQFYCPENFKILFFACCGERDFARASRVNVEVWRALFFCFIF